MRLAILAGELNHLNIMVGDIGNAYLESCTNEKVVFTAGPKFKELEGYTLVIVQALYGFGRQTHCHRRKLRRRRGPDRGRKCGVASRERSRRDHRAYCLDRIRWRRWRKDRVSTGQCLRGGGEGIKLGDAIFWMHRQARAFIK